MGSEKMGSERIGMRVSEIEFQRERESTSIVKKDLQSMKLLSQF